MNIHDLSATAVDQMRPVDLARLRQPPESPIGEFRFNESTCGVGCFVGEPPWERHSAGDELLHVLAGDTELTILTEDGENTVLLRAGAVVVVPRGSWHRNRAEHGVTMLYITPQEGNDHSFEHPRV